MPAPPANVLARFAVSVRPEPLSGRQATAWRAGDIVLKPLDMSSDALRWQAAAVLWYDADVELLSVVADRQLLVRALLFRLLASRDPAGAAAGYRRAIEFVDELGRER
jgi:hypothetical protein